MKRSSSVEAGNLGHVIEASRIMAAVDGSNWNNWKVALHSSSCRSAAQEPEPEPGMSSDDRNLDHNSSLVVCASSGLDSQGTDSSTSNSANQQTLYLSLALAFQDRLNDPRIATMLKRRTRQGDLELTSLLQDKGLDPNFAMMLKEKSLELDPTILALLQRGSLDADRDHCDNTDNTSVENAMLNQISLSEELRVQGFDKWLQLCRLVLHHINGTPERAWVLFSLIFILETIIVGISRPKQIKIINATHEQFEFGLAVLLLSPVICSIMAFLQSLMAEEMVMTSKPRKYGVIAWLLSTCVGLLLSFLSKSSLLLGLSLTVPLMVACLSVAVPIWIRNGCQFWIPRPNCTGSAGNYRTPSTKEGIALIGCMSLFAISVLALGLIVYAKPLDDLRYRGLNGDQKSLASPYTLSVFLGWAMASAIGLVVTSVLPIISWFATYRFSFSSAIFIGIFAVILVAFCGVSYLEVIKSRDDQIPSKGEFLAALLPLVCIPAVLSLCCGLLKWKDDDWKLSRGVYIFVIIGLLLLLGAISALIVVIKPWTIGVAFLLVLLLMHFLLDGLKVLSGSFILALICIPEVVSGFSGHDIVFFASAFQINHLSELQLVLLSNPIVVYSPRVLPVYVYDAHADCGKNVSVAFLMPHGVALATEGWGVVASLKIYPPFAGAAVSAITLVVSFGFAVSRPCLTLKNLAYRLLLTSFFRKILLIEALTFYTVQMMEDAIHFLSKETVVQAIARSATKRSASSAALLIGDPAIMRDRAGNFVLPRADVIKLTDRLRNEELVASFFSRLRYQRTFHREPTSDVDHSRVMCAHARILALEEAIDTEWVYMWDKFGGYLLLLLGLTSKAEQAQTFLDSIGFSDLSAKKIKKWMPEDRRRFEIIQESYIREKEMEEEIFMQRHEEEGRGKERRKALLEKEERKWKEIEASLLSSIPNASSREAAAMAAAVRAVGEQDQSIAFTGVTGAICVLDDEPTASGRHYGPIDSTLCQSQKVSFSIALMIQPESGPVCLLGTEFQKKVCWEILVAGSEQGIEAGQVGLRLITKGDRQTTVATCKGMEWHILTMTIDADLGEATCYLDGGFDGYQNGLPLCVGSSICEQGTEIWVGVRPPTDIDAFGRSDSEGVEYKMHIMDAFLWGRCLTEDEISALYASIASADFGALDFPEDNWQWADSPSRVCLWDSDPADVDLYDRDDVDWDGQCSSGRKRRSERDGVVVDVDSFSRKYRKPRIETQEEINQRMLLVELAVKEALFTRGEPQFTDQEFPPNDQSLFVDPENPPARLQVVSEWLRPGEIVRQNHPVGHPCLYSGAPNPSDVCQGRLGDCWFLSVVAVLTEVSRISEVIITPGFIILSAMVSVVMLQARGFSPWCAGSPSVVEVDLKTEAGLSLESATVSVTTAIMPFIEDHMYLNIEGKEYEIFVKERGDTRDCCRKKVVNEEGNQPITVSRVGNSVSKSTDLNMGCSQKQVEDEKDDEGISTNNDGYDMIQMVDEAAETIEIQANIGNGSNDLKEDEALTSLPA
ncbi:hypothetical protein RIF29_41876 [Crotalaria pallida]|uniref:Calpain catalytic domain-containing protein n=1 Tax=Crotalaria pallida TaxID=3830 RepID=A0AAN9E765_CROPI